MLLPKPPGEAKRPNSPSRKIITAVSPPLTSARQARAVVLVSKTGIPESAGRKLVEDTGGAVEIFRNSKYTK